MPCLASNLTVSPGFSFIASLIPDGIVNLPSFNILIIYDCLGFFTFCIKGITTFTVFILFWPCIKECLPLIRKVWRNYIFDHFDPLRYYLLPVIYTRCSYSAFKSYILSQLF